MAGNRGGRSSSSLTAKVLEMYGPVCHLRMPGCLGVATTKDHLIPYSLGGRDTLENLRPACKPCNSKRQNRVMSGYGARINVLIGPPASGKSTYVLEHAKPSDIVIDLDVIARALMPIQQERTHVYPDYVRHVAIGARKAALDRATRLAVGCTVVGDPRRAPPEHPGRVPRPPLQHHHRGPWPRGCREPCPPRAPAARLADHRQVVRLRARESRRRASGRSVRAWVELCAVDGLGLVTCSPGFSPADRTGRPASTVHPPHNVQKKSPERRRENDPQITLCSAWETARNPTWNARYRRSFPRSRSKRR